MSYDPNKYPSAWKGHFWFAWWLVQTMNPRLTVELGVDYGHSLIELARYNEGEVHGVDWFEGDAQTGSRNTLNIALQNIKDAGVRAEIVQSKFDVASEMYEDSSIDILHIDGLHTYESVKHDYETWLPKVRWGGVILLHDTESFPMDVGRLFHEITLPKFNFIHSAGLGVITKTA